MGSTTTVDPVTGVITLSNSNSFGVAGAATVQAVMELPIYPSYPQQGGRGRLIHPFYGTLDYDAKPDEWVNIDADVIIPPVWASTRTMSSAANVLWNGNIRDVVVEERWKATGGLAMPIGQLRMMLAMWTMPVDPDVGYVQWYPNYISPYGFKVIPVNLTAGGQGIVFDDVVNYKDDRGPDGWMTQPVTFTLKLVDRVS